VLRLPVPAHELHLVARDRESVGLDDADCRFDREVGINPRENQVIDPEGYGEAQRAG
jgi:hypothetical protein